MSPAEYVAQDAVGLGSLVRSGAVSAAEALQAAVAAHDEVNPQINAVTEIYPDAAEVGWAADGAFAGVPFLRKDTGPSEAGRLLEHASRLFAGNRAEFDSHFITHARDSGLRIIGRTTMPELAMTGASESIATGVTRNPWNLERSCGGSSSGSGAAVAAGIVPIASGTDSGGSLRIPASFCGVVGLCPSRGRVSDGPDRADESRGRERTFVLTRSIRDAAAALDVFSGAHLGDPFVIAGPATSFTRSLDISTRRLRVGVALSSWAGGVLDPAVTDAVRRTAETLVDMGHTVRTVEPPYDPELHHRVTEGGFVLGLATLADTARKMGRPLDEATVEPVNLEVVQMSSTKPVSYAVETLAAEAVLRRQVGEALGGFDLIVTPTMHTTAFELGRYTTMDTEISIEEFIANDALNFSFLDVFNVTGNPAMSLPLFHDPKGMPIGVQLVAGFGREDTLLQVGRDLEDALPWAGRRPLHGVGGRDLSSS